MPDDDAQDADRHPLLQPLSAPEGHATRRNIRTDTETLGESTAGLITGAMGLALGAAAGPVGALVGAIAGVAGGWWAGREIAHALTGDDDQYYRAHYERTADRPGDRSYDQLRPAYVAGHLAGRNPEYGGRSFAEIEGDLRRAWEDSVAEQCGEWPAVRPYAHAAFERARGTPPAS
jgi:hypothetical protein